MSKGGYKIISLQDKNISLEGTINIPGIYESLESNYRKATLLSDVTIDSVEHTDLFVDFTVKNSIFECRLGDNFLQISDNDDVLYTKTRLV